MLNLHVWSRLTSICLLCLICFVFVGTAQACPPGMVGGQFLVPGDVAIAAPPVVGYTSQAFTTFSAAPVFVSTTPAFIAVNRSFGFGFHSGVSVGVGGGFGDFRGRRERVNVRVRR